VYKGFINLNYKPSANDLVCSFIIEPNNISMEEAANAVAGESSVGTWTNVVTMSDRIKKMGAVVFSIEGNNVKIAYPHELFEPGNMPQILSSIAGNIFGMKIVKSLRLEDVRWSSSLIKSFRGPMFGIKGIREVTKVEKRPLCGTIVKPKLGLSDKDHAKVAYQAWVGDIDIVKDDENLSSQSFNKFEKRIVETLKMRNKAEREEGERKMYMPNITAPFNEMMRRAEFLVENNADYAMVDILTVGWSALQELREANEDLKLILHAHRAGHAALTRNPKHGISMLVLADIARLIGVDQLHIGTVVGKMEGGKEEVIRIGEEIESKIVEQKGNKLSENWKSIKPVMAVCSGGLHPGMVPSLVKNLGNDIVIQAGGGIHGHRNGTTAGAKALRQAVEATMQGVDLREFAEKHKELKTALDQWGYI